MARTAINKKEQGPLRRLPTQQRSRERAERILASASDLIAESGSVIRDAPMSPPIRWRRQTAFAGAK